ncbi:MAG: sugar porter family MFS transporter [Pirellulales bacterium]|nr:sugar porter family MFS transporter [Pirellulales bacterium]
MKRLPAAAYSFCIAFVASVGGFLFGYDLAVMGVANQYLKTQFHLSEWWHGFSTASATLGCAAGPFLGAWLCDRIGRRRTLLGASLLLALGSLLTAIPRDIVTFNVFRIVGGVGVGLCSIASPMYIAEVAPPRRRGALGFMYQLAIVAGCILSILVACRLADGTSLDSPCWRWMFGSELIPVALFLGFLFFIPETPRWLAARDRDEEALAVLTRIENPEYARKEIAEIRQSLREETGRWGELIQPGLRKALLIGILLAIFNNYTGWSGIYNYLPEIFKRAGYLETTDANYQYLLAFSFMGAMTLIACFFVDRLGRRPLWLIGALLMIGANILVGGLFQGNATGLPVLLGIFLMAIPHSFALGPLPWLMMSELYPTRNRARAVAITTTALWITSFFPVMLFPLLQKISMNTLGTISGVFFFYAFLSLLALIFGAMLLPETKGKTLEQIAESWKR